MNKTQINARFKSFKDNYDLLNINNYLYIDDNNDSANKKERLSYTQDNIMNKKEGIDFFNSILKKTGDKYNFNKSENIEQKNIPRNNYSVSNIPEIKIKKMIFPDFLSKRNSKIEKKNSSSSNKNIQNLSNNKPSSARYMLKEGTNRKRKFFDLTKLVDYKNNKIKNKRFSESSKTIDKSMEHKIKDNLKSLLVINTKQKINSYNNLINLRKGQKTKLSFEKRDNKKDENIQIEHRKSNFSENNLKEMMTIKPKNFK